MKSGVTKAQVSKILGGIKPQYITKQGDTVYVRVPPEGQYLVGMYVDWLSRAGLYARNIGGGQIMVTAGRKNPVRTAHLSESDYQTLPEGGAYSQWSPATAQIVKIIGFMDRTSRLPALRQAYAKALAVSNKHYVNAQVFNDIGSTYVAAHERITGLPYPYVTAEEMRATIAHKRGMELYSRSRRRR